MGQKPGIIGMKLQRIKLGLSQRDLEDITDIPQWRLSLIERGIQPRPDEVGKLTLALNTPKERLFCMVY